MSHPTFIKLPYKLERDPPPFEGNDIKSPESLMRHFITLYSKQGGKVFDPFVGLGTTMFMAEELERVPYGVEYDTQRFEWVAGQLENWGNIVNGDSAGMAGYGFPKMDLCLTAPPFMKKSDKWNPLFWGDPAKAGYDAYLKRMKQIFKQLPEIMKKGGTVVVQVDNLNGREFTPLVRDLGNLLSGNLRCDGEVVVAFDNAPEAYPHTHCLIFKNV